MKTLLIIASLVLCTLGFTGCGGKKTGGDPQKVLRPTKQPPKVPPAQYVPIDQGLREQAKQELSTALTNADPFVRAHALEAIQNVLPDQSAAVVAMLSDREAVVRFAATMAAGELKLDEARPLLPELADDKHPAVRIGARYALHRLGDYRLSKELETLSQSDDKQIRSTTAMALGLMGDPSGLNVLRPMQADRNAAVRLQVAESMWRLGDTDGRDTLIGAIVSKFPDEQMVATLGLASTRDARVRGHVRANLTSDYVEVALVAARAMGQLGSDAGYTIAMNGVKSADPRQRALAGLALGAIGRPDAQEALGKLLKDPVADVRLSAATGLLQLK